MARLTRLLSCHFEFCPGQAPRNPPQKSAAVAASRTSMPGKDDLGQPTINGMKALSFRIEKLMPKSKWSKKSLEEEE